MRTLKVWATAVGLMVLAATTAQAALVSQGDGTVRDTNTNLIWLQDWNINGAQNLATQGAWAQGLTFAGSSDWVLPEISEYDALFTAYGDLTAVTNFTNVLPGNYWSGTDDGGGGGWRFNPFSGGQNIAPLSRLFSAVAVRPGDVAAVPEPQTLALALLALGATVVVRKRRPR